MSTPLALNATELEFMQRGVNPIFPTTPDHPPTLTPTQLVLSPSNLVNPGGEPVNKLIYAGFLEHLGRCIYGGIVDDPKDPSDKKLLIEQEKGRLGVRKDVAEIIGAEGELAVPMLRWPGGEFTLSLIVKNLTDKQGNFVSNYHWQDAIGPVENRPKRIELAWLSDESNMSVTVHLVLRRF
jgi:alpha-N-arabinofuranosidase